MSICKSSENLTYVSKILSEKKTILVGKSCYFFLLAFLDLNKTLLNFFHREI